MILKYISLASIISIFITSAYCKVYYINQNHSKVGFNLEFMGHTKIIGHVQEFEGHFEYMPDSGSLQSILINTRTCSIETGDVKRDVSIQEPDLFDCQRHPWAKFTANEIETLSAKKYLAKGHLTIKGNTREVTLEVEFLSRGKKSDEGEQVFFSFKTMINREDFNLVWNRQLEKSQWLVGNQVEIKGEIQASEKGAKDEYSTQSIPQGRVRDYQHSNSTMPSSLVPTPKVDLTPRPE